MVKSIVFSFLIVLSTLCLNGMSHAAEDETKQIWDKLLKNYTKQFRPGYDGEAAIIQLGGYILSLPEIDSVKEELTCNLYFRQIWMEPRLVHQKGEALKLDGSNSEYTKIWQPDTFIVNELRAQRHEMTHPNILMIVFPNGTVRSSSRYTVVTNCPMHFANFPFDEQECPVQFESYGYGAQDLVYQWINRDFGVNPGISHASFRIVGHKTESSSVTLSSGRYSRAQFQILFRRECGRYLIEFYYPCIFLATLSILSLFISEPKISVALNFLTMCVTILFLSVSTGSLDVPRVSYTTALDQFSSMTNTFVFLSLLASLVTLRLSTSNIRPQNFELSSLRSQTHTRLESGGDDEDSDPVSQQQQQRPTTLPQTKFEAVLKIFVDIFALILPYLKIVLVIAYLFANLIYWTTVPYKRPKYDDALMSQDWQLY